MSLKCGIVGLPNVGKSTLFNALTNSNKAQAANFPFCTIDPNVGIVAVPDNRLNSLAKISKSKKVINTTISFVDIAGLVKGASKGEGLGNKFLSHIREVDAIIHMIRCFDSSDIQNVNSTVDPVRDLEIIETEMMLADLESIQKRLEKNNKKNVDESIIKILEHALECINNDKDIISFDSMNIPENNTVSKSLNLLREINDFSKYFEINITKNIPTESGLGGGSSNAGALLSKLSEVYNLSIPSNEDVAQKIGSDVPFFISGQPAFVTGIGDIIEPKKIDIELNMLLVVPNEIVSTAKAFLEFDRLKNTSTLVNTYKDIKLFNDFWNPSTTIEPNLIKIKDYLESSTDEEFFLSGSGSSMFCLGTLDNLQKKFDLIDENQFRIVKIVKKIDFSLETISD